MPTLYLETNLLVGIALGQEPPLDAWIPREGESLRLAIPSVCFMEAFSTFKAKKRSNVAFSAALETQMRALRRDSSAEAASQLLAALLVAEVKNRALLGTIEDRLFTAVEHLAGAAILIQPSPRALVEALGRKLIDDPTDNLILHCVIAHAAADPDARMAFLSGNAKDFGRPKARAALQDAGISFLARRAEALAWLGSA